MFSGSMEKALPPSVSGADEDSLLDRYVVAKAAELALEPDPARVIRRRVDGVVRRAALRTGVVMVVRKVACAMVPPARCRVDQPRPVQGLDTLREGNLWVWWREQLAPAFVVYDLSKHGQQVPSWVSSHGLCTYPGHDARVAQVLVDEDVELALKLLLLRRVRREHARRHAGHVLDHHETETVTGIVKEIRLDFDLRKSQPTSSLATGR